jgi:superfamily II DNA or RNA helicase
MPRNGGTPDSSGYLATITTGDVLGRLGRTRAELAHRINRAREVAELRWTGSALEATALSPYTVVVIQERPAEGLEVRCSACGDDCGICAHAGAALLRWIEVRTGVLRQGPGTVWRAGQSASHLAAPPAGSQSVDLTRITDANELAASVRFQLALRPAGVGAWARLAEDRIEIGLTLSSGAQRTVVAAAAAVPLLLPLLRTMDVALEEPLDLLEVTGTTLRARLRSRVQHNGSLLLEPGYRTPGDAFLPIAQAQQASFGRWVRVGHRLHHAPEPPARLLPFFRRGRRLLRGDAALRFLSHDHFLFQGETWYEPQGELAASPRPDAPLLTALDVTGGTGSDVVLRPLFRAGGETLSWDEVRSLMRAGFARHGASVYRAPDLRLFTEAGFRMRAEGLKGDRLALARLVLETGVAVRAGKGELTGLLDTLTGDSPLLADPPGLRSQLRPYQRRGAAWLLRLYHNRLGALLADDMGLGKTHQAMALLCHVRAEQPAANSLVVCPRGVLEHWLHLLQEFAPDLPVSVFHGSGRSLAGLPAGDLVVTTYDIALRSAGELARRKWEVAIFDEAQRIKNPRSKAARAVKSFPASFRVALTGTPIENHLAELWSVVDLVLPGYLGSERGFRLSHRNPTPEQVARLTRRMAPFLLRRVKETVLEDLPDKVEEILYCRLTPEQHTLYRKIHGEAASPISERLADAARDVPYIHIFALLTRLKQVCDHPALLAPHLRDVQPGKLALLDEILDEALAAEHRVVVFSQYVKMIELLARHLQRRRLSHLTLTGGTRERGDLLARFNSGRHEPLLLASLLAGGVGIDLTAASVVVHYDRWWNPARENQATDRVHRYGQRRPVQVFKLLTEDTIEERIDRIIRRKAELAAEVVAPTEEVLRRLTRAELAELLDLHLPPDTSTPQ